MHPKSGLLQFSHKSENGSGVKICQHDVIVIFFWCCRVSFVMFSYWCKFHVNIITGARVMTIFLYKGLTRNPEIGNIPVWVLPNIWRLVLGIQNLAWISLMICYYMLQNSRITAFTISELLRKNQQRGE